MGRLLLAFKTFFVILGNRDVAQRIEASLQADKSGPVQTPVQPEPVVAQPAPPPKKSPPAPVQNPAVTLLETLQREARLLDFLMEPIVSYSDAQVGAAVREIHRGCHATIQRCFSLKPVMDQPEDSPVTLSKPFSAAKYRVLGNPPSGETVNGRLVHPGWRVEKCELPTYQGDAEAANIVAPAEVEVR